MPRVSTFGVSWNAPPEDRTKPSSSRVRSNRRAVGRASPAAVATSVRDMLRLSASKQARTSSPRASASTKSGPVPRPAMLSSRGLLSAAEDPLLATGALRLVLVLGVLVRVLQDLGLGVRPLGEHALLPGLLTELGSQVLDRRVDLPAYGSQVDADQLAVVLHHPSVDHDGVHVATLGLERDVPVRVEQREGHGGVVVPDQDDVGLLARLEAAEVVAAEGLRPASRGAFDDVLGP